MITDPYREPVRSRYVGRHKISPGLFQPEQEVRVARLSRSSLAMTSRAPREASA